MSQDTQYPGFKSRAGRGLKKRIYREDDIFIPDEPHFLQQIPAWHREVFPANKTVYHPEAERILVDTVLAINQVGRVMSVKDLCLLILPFPKLWMERQRLKNVIYDATRLNAMKLFSGESTLEKDRSARWYECLNGHVELEYMEDAAKRGWLLDYGVFIHIWRRYVDEREQYSMEVYASFDKVQNVNDFATPAERREVFLREFIQYAETEGFDYLGLVPRPHKSLFIKKFMKDHEKNHPELTKSTLEKDWEILQKASNRIGKGVNPADKK